VDSDLGKLRWRCRRGMKELDVLLTRYVDEDYGDATAREQRAFRELLESPDPLLHAYFLGRESPSDAVLRSLVEHMMVKQFNQDPV
jgi:antitoxin CptB